MITAETGARAAILVVDDDDRKHLAIRAVLEPLGHEIVGVDSGEEALRAVMTRTFAVILMDVHMPAMDGYETARYVRMREQSARTPIIFITAHSRDEAQVSVAYASGAVDFIFAPLVPDILRAKVGVFVELYLKSHELEGSLHAVTTLSEQFRDSEARTRTVLENVADGIVTIGSAGLVESLNRAATEMFGLEETDAVGRPFSSLFAPEHRDFFTRDQSEQRSSSRSPGTSRSVELLGRRKDGSTFPAELDLNDVPIGPDEIRIACLRDVSQRRAYTETLEHQALHDALTGLPNRVLFADRVAHAMRAAARAGQPLALLLLDLNGFKRVNDTLGHQHGDVLLKLVAERLAGALRDGDTVARLGGDEFGILPLGPTDVAGAAAVAWKIEQALEPAFFVINQEVGVRASIGIALIPDHGDTIDDLLRRADLAMYRAKAAGGGHAVFAEEQEDGAAYRLALLGDLRQCIERDELVLHYQPKVDLATRKTVGVEALIRWNHPSGRFLQPDEFMPELENSELMVPITAWVIGEALRQVSVWREAGYDLTVAVNVGARWLAQGIEVSEQVDALTRKWDVPPERLTLEFLESALNDVAVPEVLTRLDAMGERLSIDHFGVGSSSLLQLQRLPVGEFKADHSLVATLATVDGDAVVVRAIIDLAHNLGGRAVAAGVTDATTLDRLIEDGCDVAQGDYFSRPLAAGELANWLDESPFGYPQRRSRPTSRRRPPRPVARRAGRSPSRSTRRSRAPGPRRRTPRRRWWG